MMEKEAVDRAALKVAEMMKRMKRAKEAIDEEALEGESERED